MFHGAIRAAAILGVAAAAHGQLCPSNWGNVFPGGELSGIARGSVVFDDGAGASLYVVGDFHYAGAMPVHCVARWDGEHWWNVGQGLNAEGVSGAAQCLAVFDDDGAGPRPPMLYAGGSFTLPNTSTQKLARWNGTAWESTSGNWSPNGTVYALAVHNDGTGPALYAGTSGNAPGFVQAPAKFNGTTWTAVGTAFNSGAVIRAIASLDPDGPGPAPAELVVGGLFTSAGGSAAANVARWNGSAWSAMGSGRPGQVNALVVFDGGTSPALHAGGLGTDPVARWSGAAWAVLGPGQQTGPVDALIGADPDGPGPVPTRLYAGGSIGTGASTYAGVRAWDGGSWSTPSDVVGFEVFTLAAYDPPGPPPSSLYAGGQIFGVGYNLRVNNIARFDGALWHKVGPGSGPDGYLSTILSHDPDGGGPQPADLYVGGLLTQAGPTPVSGVARRSGQNWFGYPPLAGDGLFSPTVNACAVYDDGNGAALYIGGFFVTAGGVPVNHIARWGGSAWEPLGSGLAGTSFSFPTSALVLTVFDEDGAGPGRPALFVGGDFLTAGGVNARGVARWDGTSWSAVGTGLTGRVASMTIHDDGSGPALYISGVLMSIPTGSSRLVRWNGTTLSAVGPGSGVAANCMASFDEDGAGPNPASLFVGGLFSSVGGTTIHKVARWNGVAWSAVGNVFTLTNSTEVNRMAVYDDDGAGPNPASLYVHGRFTAFGLSSPGLARWNGTAWVGVPGLGAQTIDFPYFAMGVHDDGIVAGVPGLYLGGSFTSAGGLSASKLARWGPTSGPMIGRQPISLTRDPGADVLFCISAGGSGALSYQWRKGGQSLSDTGRITGTASATLILRDITAADAGSYDCMVSSTCGSVTSSAATLTVSGSCYPNCDASTTPPVLNVQDFTCFLQRYAAGDSYANCDSSTIPPTLNVQDFTCFLQAYAAGCP
jgi:trimeric autotransporter adhesin